MKKFILTCLFCYLCCLPTYANAKLNQSTTKVSTNFVNLIVLADVNLNIENYVKPKHSFILGAHSNPDETNHSLTGIQGGYAGYRIYPNLLNKQKGLAGDFIQLTFGLNGHKKIDPQNLEKIDYIPSVEFWMGNSHSLGNQLYFEAAVGVGRKFETESKPFILAGLNLVFGL